MLVDRDGRVVVTDFGIASSPELSAVTADHLGGAEGPAADDQGAEQGPSLTRTGAILGTPRYMAPEQHAGGKVDARADQFSFAVSLHEALYDTPPFAGESAAELRRSIALGRVVAAPTPPRRKVPARVRSAVLRALAVLPEDRFPSLDALLAALSEPAWPRRVWVRARPAVAVALALVVAAGAWSLVARARRPTPVVAAPSAGATPRSVGLDAGGKRPAVVLLPFVNRTGDARLDGVSELVMATSLLASRKLDPLSAAQIGLLARSLDAPAGLDVSAAARELAGREGRVVVTVAGTLTREGDAIAAGIEVTRTDTGAVLLSTRVAAAGAEEIVPASLELAARLRTALLESAAGRRRAAPPLEVPRRAPRLGRRAPPLHGR